MPFGIYLHYYFKCNFKKTILATFCLSLFFELTQLSGLYFIYPRGYRLFDIDDLILNTLGGLIGYFIGNLVNKILPSRDSIDKRVFILGTKVTLSKRIVAFFLDIFIFHVIYFIFLSLFSLLQITNFFNKLLYLLVFILYSYVRPLNNNQKTYAQQFLNLKLTNIKKEKKTKWWQLLLYDWYFYFINIGIFSYFIIFLQYLHSKNIIHINPIYWNYNYFIYNLWYYLFNKKNKRRIGIV
jgi:hypothetical protein